MKKQIIGSFLAAFVLAGMATTLASPADIKDAGTSAYVAATMQPTPESMAQRETDWMTTELSLTADQVTKVSEINVKYAQKQMEMFQGGPPPGGGGDMSAMQQQMADTAAQKRTELQPILPADQLQKYDEYLANNPGGGRGGPGGPGGGPGGPGGGPPQNRQ